MSSSQIISCIVYIFIWRSIMAIIAQSMISKKGYDENWAIWGFIFGILTIIIILIKPNVNQTNVQIPTNTWKCTFCKSTNLMSSSVCSCGKTKEDTVKAIKAYRLKQKQLQNIELLKKYKELLDTGVISQNEFETKKKELLK